MGPGVRSLFSARDGQLFGRGTIMKKDIQPAAPFTLECRTGVCRVLVAEPDGADTNRWWQALQKDPELKERTSSAFRSGRPTRDPLSGASLSQVTAFLKLADPSAGRAGEPGTGAGAPAGRGGPAGAAPAAAPPASAASCRTELEGGERRLAAMRAAIDRDSPMHEVFARSFPNDALTADFGGLVRRILGLAPGSSDTQVECRARICRVNVSRTLYPESNVWWRKLDTNPELQRRILSGLYGDPSGVFWRIREDHTAVGMDALRKLVAELEASPGFSACETKNPGAAGQLRIRFLLAGVDDVDPEHPGKITADYGGALADTPLARCIADEAARTVLSASLPADITGATLYEHYDFPRKRPAVDSAPSRR
jgi:hypothetical protein